MCGKGPEGSLLRWFARLLGRGRHRRNEPKGISRSEVIRLREDGMTIPKIARRFGCAKSSIDYHLYPNVRKLHRVYGKRRKEREGYRRRANEYYMKKYRTDPKFHRKVLESAARYRKLHKRDG